MPELTGPRRRLDKAAAEKAISHLRTGKPLPESFRNLLFENKREYELAYAAKEQEAHILANTIAVPVQPVKTFGEGPEGWRNLLIFGDNLQVLKTLLRMKEDGSLLNADGTPGVRLCYIDPPFATRRDFIGGRGQAAYADKVAGAEFIEALRKRLIFIREILADNGTLYVHLDWKKGHYIKVILDELFGPSNFRNEIIWWYYNKYQGNINRFPSNHDSIYAYSKSSTAVFNPVMEEREELARFLKRIWDPDTQKLVNAKDQQGRVVYVEKDDRRVDDVWRLSMLQPADRTEKVDFPTQKPETLLSLIVAASSNPGDVVLDAFGGSGTTAVVAERLGRRWIAIDSSKLAIYTTQKRLLRLGADQRRLLRTAPFVVANAGLYDYTLLKTLPWEAFRTFALELFQCRDDPHHVGRLFLDGYRGLDHVLVFNFQRHQGAVLDESYFDDLHAAVGDRVGRRFFVIAPASSVRFLQDYIERKAQRHDVRYFVLRIPYSIIDQLHERGFTRLQQPISEAAVNETIDAVGFDFVQPPLVESVYRRTRSQLSIQIKSFEAEGMIRGSDNPSGLSALAMVMIDLDYDGNVFDLDQVYYAEDLTRNGFSMSVPLSAVGTRLMVIYVDIYGNEHREVKNLGDVRRPSARR